MIQQFIKCSAHFNNENYYNILPTYYTYKVPEIGLNINWEMQCRE